MSLTSPQGIAKLTDAYQNFMVKHMLMSQAIKILI